MLERNLLKRGRPQPSQLARRVALCAFLLCLGLSSTATPAALSAREQETALAALKSDSLELQRFAMWTLSQHPVPDEHLPTLVALLDTRDAPLQRYVMQALGRRGDSAIPLLIEHLKSRPRTRNGERLLVELGPQSVPALVDLASSATPLATRRGALRALADIGPSAAPLATGPLLDALARAPHRTERTLLADTLGGLGDAILPTLLKSAERHPELGEYVSLAIARMETDSDQAMEFLLASLESPQPRQRFSAARALGNLGPKAVPAVPQLLTLLQRDPNASAQMYSAEALGKIAPNEPQVLTALVAALGPSDPPVATKLVGAIAAAGPAAIPVLEPQLLSAEPTARARSVAVLREIAGKDATRCSLLFERLDDPVEQVRDAAALALRHIGSRVGDQLIAAVQADPRARVRAYLTLVLGQIEPAEERAIPVLIAGLTDPDPTVRQMSAWSIGKFGSLAKVAAPDLLKCLEAEDRLLRRNAAWALGTLGAVQVEPELERHLADPAPEVVSEVEEALAKLRGTYEKVEP